MPTSPIRDSRSGDSWPKGSLRRIEQTVAGVILLAAFALIGGHSYRQHLLRQRRIDIDRMPVQVAQFQIDINAADWPEFALLPGVGEILAKRIVADRETNGPFRDWNDLRRVRGIGPKTFNEIRPFLLPMADLSATAGP